MTWFVKSLVDENRDHQMEVILTLRQERLFFPLILFIIFHLLYSQSVNLNDSLYLVSLHLLSYPHRASSWL